ncbi:hypothetical protein KR093_001237, partial [Drosophila rubida]
KNMSNKRSNQILFWTTLFTLTVCIILISLFSGYSHEPSKFKIILVTLVLVIFFHYLVGDPIKFIIHAINASCWPPNSRKYATDEEATHHNRLDYLKLRLQGLRGLLFITERHRDEKLNNKYKHIVSDLSLYGKYFFFVMCTVLITLDEHKFYTTQNIKHLFNMNDTIYFGLKNVHEISDVYEFIESSLINAFSPDVNNPEQADWVHGEQTVLVGVVRLRQLRLIEHNYGLSEPPFTDQSYAIQWELPYVQYPYDDHYWRIFEPWKPMKPSTLQQLIMNFKHNGFYRNYPELQGYVALLARSRQNSLTILKYLHDYKWLNYNTSAIFMDFALYNVDANILIVCTLRVEQTPFGGVIPYVEVETIRLLQNLHYISTTALIVQLLYTIVFVQFFKALSVKLWFNPHELRYSWNKVDVGIFLLNIFLLAFIIIREVMVSSILDEIEEASKMHFIELRYASRLQMAISMVLGFLISITTLRLWKVLQFSTAFQLFTHTLYIAWRAVASTAIAICIFIMGFAVAVSIMNGNNSTNFQRLGKSIVSCMCFALGFDEGVTPEDLYYGGSILGIILYAILVFVISVLLINVFVSLINDYFTTAKDQRDTRTRAVHKISIFEFLRVEYYSYLKFLRRLRIFRQYYKGRNRTVSENIKRDMDVLEKYRRRHESLKTFVLKKKLTQFDVELEYEEFRQHQERVYTIGAIIKTQIEIL